MKPILGRLRTGAAVVLAAACGGGGDGGAGPVTVASVVITAPVSAPVFGALGRAIGFAAQARDAGGTALTRTITWSTSNAAVASVNSTGQVTSVGNGTAEIRAISEGVQSAALLVTVSQVTASVVITPGSLTFGALGSTRALSAEARDSTGNAVPGRSATWSGGIAGIATVSAAGLVTSLGDGTAQATATIDGISANATITVAVLVATVTVTPGGVVLHTIGRTQQYAAVARDSNSNILVRNFTWSSSNTSAATVDGNGLATAAGDGAPQVRAAAGGVTGEAQLTVAIVVLSVNVQPMSTFTRIGQVRQVVAQALDSLGNVVAGRALTYSSSDPATVLVNAASGVATSQQDGGVTITVGLIAGSATGTTGATVAAVALDVAATPASIAFGALGSSHQVAAIVRDSGGTAIPGRTVSFTLLGPGATASVSASGLVGALAVGTGDTALASYTGAEGTLTAKIPISVTQVPAAVAVSSPSLGPDTLRTTTRTILHTAAAADSNGNAIPGAVFQWSSTLPQVAAVDITGLVTAGGTDGTALIRAMSGTVTGERPIVVERYAETFLLAPGSASISTNDGTQLFSGTAQDSVLTNLPITWMSRNIAVLTLSSGSGTATTATAQGNGSTYVVMSAGTRRDSALVTVANQVSISFAAQVQPIFTANCALSGCHTGTLPSGNMNLAAGQAWGQTVNVLSNGDPARFRIQPGDPDNSYLIRKLEGGPGIIGGRMPQGSAPLPVATIQIIRDWVTAGALNN